MTETTSATTSETTPTSATTSELMSASPGLLAEPRPGLAPELPEDPTAAGSDRLTGRQRLALVLLLGTQFMLAIDFSILNVALPSIGAGVGMSEGNLQWIATAFALPSAGFTLLFARVADLTGRRRAFLVGLGVLIVASLVGGLANSPGLLLAARVGQGLAAAIAIPAALSLLVTTFPEGAARRRALGLNGALLPAGFTVGALVGGLLTGYLSWRWAFLVNVPVALVILVAAPRVVSEGRAAVGGRLDVPGALTVTGGLVAFVYGISSGGQDGWARPSVWIALVGGVVLLIAFWRIEATSPHPLASLAVLRRRNVGWGNVGGFAVFALESAVVFLLTLYLQQVLGYSALTTGLVFGVPGVAAFVAGIVAPRIMSRIDPRTSLVLALVIQALSNLALVFVGLDRTAVVLVLIASVIGFFGHAYGIAAYLVTATSGLRDAEQGLATGVAMMTQQVAITLGIPILSAIVTARASALSDTHTAREATLGGIQLALLVDGIVTLVVAGLVAVFLLRPFASRRGAP